MYTENQINKLIKPLLINQQKKEGIILNKLASRLKQIKTLSPSDVQLLINLRNSGSDVKDINKQLASLSKLDVKEIKKIIKLVAKDNYNEAKPFYDYRHKSFIPFEQNITLQRQIKAVEQLTLGEYNNLTNTTAFMLRDITNPLIIRPTSLSKTYNTILDYAIQSVTSNLDTYNNAIPQAIQTLIDKGITTVEYTSKSGKKRNIRVDSAVKNSILNGIRQVQQEVQNVVGYEIESNAVEISVHMHSAPDHEPIQGHQLMNEEFEKLQLGQPFKDINGKLFNAIDRPIGMWNCRHFVWNIIAGHKTPNYTEKELENIKQSNANGITIKDKNGNYVKKSMYWCEQRRNKYELEIRKLKEMQKVAKKCLNKKVEEEYKIKAIDMQNKYTAFCRQCGLKPRYTNLRIFI